MTRHNYIERLNALAATLNEVNTTFNRAIHQCETLIHEELAHLSAIQPREIAKPIPTARHESIRDEPRTVTVARVVEPAVG